MADHNDPNLRMDDDYEDTKRYSVARGIVVTVISVLILGVFVAGVTIAYQLGLETGTSKVTPIIRADTSPTKVRPSKPGGMKIPNQDKAVYGQIGETNGQPKNEKLLPTAERPIESLLMTIRPATVPEPADGSSNGEKPNGDAVAAAPKPAPSVTVAEPPAVKLPPPPPAEKPLPVRPSEREITGSKKPGETIVAAVPPPPPPPTVTAKPAKKVKPAPTAKRVASVDTSSKPKKTAGRYTVQLASAKSAKGARQTWSKLRKAHPTLFGSVQESIVRKNLGKKGTWYRLMAGSFSDASTARKFCNRAKSRKVPCLVTRR